MPFYFSNLILQFASRKANIKDVNAGILLSYKAEQYYKGYKKHEHEFVPEVKKDWNDQLKHEIQQQEIRKQKRAMLFQQGRQQERE